MYCEAVVAFCELFVRNNQVIFDQIEEWGELDGFKIFLSERPSKESIENLLRQAEGMYQIAEERGKKEEGMFFFFFFFFNFFLYFRGFFFFFFFVSFHSVA